MFSIDSKHDREFTENLLPTFQLAVSEWFTTMPPCPEAIADGGVCFQFETAGSVVDFMQKYLLLILLAIGLVAFLPQRAKADGYFGISVGPAYCDPYPVYYGGYYPRYYRQYYYYDNPYRYGRHHRHWHHDDDD
jgi:hypothetical protein